ncbi:hypothetical protein ACFU5O_09370 [Streptomyces sp. NPDC057445]|uniref:hypothetical protein n=1 Tax=Streptomyces sp. NPDC057445 TaxID=3346136 RepID=UPI0036920C23
MARHTLLRAAGLAVTAVGAALGAGAGSAQAAQVGDLDPAAALHALDGTAGHMSGPVEHVPLNPLANTGVDPLDNGVGTQVADFRPVNSRELTGSLGGVDDVPVAGPLLGGITPG